MCIRDRKSTTIVKESRRTELLRRKELLSETVGILETLSGDLTTAINNAAIDGTLRKEQLQSCLLYTSSVQFQEYFRDSVIKECRRRGFYLPISSTDNQTSKKELRIKTLQPLVKNGTIRFLKKHRRLLEQLKLFPLADHDDGPDCLEMAVRKAKRPNLQSMSY